MEREITVSGQPGGKRLEFCPVAMNKAIQGEPSNGVLAVFWVGTDGCSGP
uniref:Uncharacterized protein n=1 Tax=Candidatus Kentrum sp. LFY TaxID=2126342 RepID=A0A450U6Q6_9GAMM|nr:MAG: hypothetical protein BECKLFY1418A_GA0070994_100173 [Candidatus Kentron sp. LFY]